MVHNSSQRGFAPIVIVIVLGALFAAGVGIYLKGGPSDLTGVFLANPTPIPTAEPSGSEITPTGEVTPTPTSARTSTPTTAKFTPTPTRVPTATPTPVRKNSCEAHVTYGKLNGDTSNPLLVTLVYSFTGYNNTYMTGAQWDFDGNGTWDTDLKQSNGTIEHTYESGTYHPRLQLQDSNGSMTDVCTGEVVVSGIDVTLIGKAYNDLNCNHLLDVGETGIPGASITIMDANGTVYSTASTNGDGDYTFTKNIKPSESLTLLAANNGDRGGVYNPPAVTLSASKRTGIINLPYVSPDRYGYCN